MSHSVHVRKPKSPRTSSERIMYVKRERNAFQIHLQYPVCTLHLPALALNTASYTENITTKQLLHSEENTAKAQSSGQKGLS